MSLPPCYFECRCGVLVSPPDSVAKGAPKSLTFKMVRSTTVNDRGELAESASLQEVDSFFSEKVKKGKNKDAKPVKTKTDTATVEWVEEVEGRKVRRSATITIEEHELTVELYEGVVEGNKVKCPICGEVLMEFALRGFS